MNKAAIEKAIFINGNKCDSKENLFAEFSKKLHFPDYFSNNWDSFEEILLDVTLSSEVMLYNFDKILINDMDNQIIFKEIIQDFNEQSETKFYKITTV